MLETIHRWQLYLSIVQAHLLPKIQDLWYASILEKHEGYELSLPPDLSLLHRILQSACQQTVHFRRVDKP